MCGFSGRLRRRLFIAPRCVGQLWFRQIRRDILLCDRSPFGFCCKPALFMWPPPSPRLWRRAFYGNCRTHLLYSRSARLDLRRENAEVLGLSDTSFGTVAGVAKLSCRPQICMSDYFVYATVVRDITLSGYTKWHFRPSRLSGSLISTFFQSGWPFRAAFLCEKIKQERA